MGKEKRALSTFLSEKFSQDVLFVRPGVRCRRGGRACAPCPLPRSSSSQPGQLLCLPERRLMAT